MCITEYNEEQTLNKIKRESREEGREEGILEALIGLVKDGLLPLSVAAQRSNMTVPEFEAKTGLNV